MLLVLVISHINGYHQEMLSLIPTISPFERKPIKTLKEDEQIKLFVTISYTKIYKAEEDKNINC